MREMCIRRKTNMTMTMEPVPPGKRFLVSFDLLETTNPSRKTIVTLLKMYVWGERAGRLYTPGYTLLAPCLPLPLLTVS